MTKRIVSSAAFVVAFAVWGSGSWAQSGDAADDIDDQVAASLFERGKQLYSEGDHANAKKLFIESLERSPKGPAAKDSLAFLRNSNEKLGVSDLDDGRPGVGGEGPKDPYADADGPRDPYAGGDGPGDDPKDPYGAAGEPKHDPERGARRTLLAWGGAYGFSLGLALAGPQGDDGEIGGGAFLVGALGAGAGAGLSHLLYRRKPMTAGQSAFSASAGTWAALDIALMVDVFDTDGTDVNDIYKGVAAGGLLGFGAGAYYAYKKSPSVGDVSFTNSLAMYGAAGGLLLGVGISPAEGEAYSLQAVLGSTAGFVAGLWLSDRVDTTRRRMLMVDLGAAAGAAIPWALLYPLINDSGTNNDEQAVGWISALTLGGGAVAAWFLTRDEPEAAAPLSEPEESAGPMAVLRRTRRGKWQLAAPVLRPMHNPVLAPSTGGLSLGIDLLGGTL